MNLFKRNGAGRIRSARRVSLIPAVLAAVAMLSGGGIAAASDGGASASGQLGAVGTLFQLRPGHAPDKCLDVRNNDGGTANGTPVQLWTCLGPTQANQIWQAVPMGGGFFQVRPRHAPDMCLDARNNDGGTADGTPIQLWTCLGAEQTNQLWRTIPILPGHFQVRPRHAPDMCLDVRNNDGGTADGTRIQLFTCRGAEQTNQLWQRTDV